MLAQILEDAWNARHGHKRLPRDWEEQLRAARVSDRRLERLERVVDQLDGLVEHRHALWIGEQMTLEWPRAERR